MDTHDDNHDEPSDGGDTWKQHAELSAGGIRRVDSLDLARMRLPESNARSKSRKSNLGKSSKGDDKNISANRSSVSAGILNIMGMGSSSSQMVRA